MTKSTGNAKALFVSLLLLAAPQIVLACVWYPHTAIQCSGITAPDSGKGYACNSEVTCSVATPSDTDKRVAGETTYPADTFNGENAFVWTCGGGSFKNGDNKGQTVTWIAPNSPSSSVTITVTINDDAQIPQGESGDRDDSALQKQVTVKVYKIRCLKLEATSDVDIWWINADDDASYEVGHTSNIIWEAYFDANGDLQLTVWRKSVADVFREPTQHFTLNVTLGRWPSCTTDDNPYTYWHTNKGDSGNFYGWSGTCSIADASCIEWIQDLNIDFSFKVGDRSVGSHAITGIQRMCIYDNYECDQADFTRYHIQKACTWGSGGTEVTKEDIPHKVQENCWRNFKWEIWVDPWSLETQKGDCRPHSGLIEAALEVLGIPANGVSTSDDDTYKVGEERWCEEHDAWEWHYFNQAAGSLSETNFQAVCQVYLTDEESPYSCYYDKAMGSPYQYGTYAEMWTEWNSYPPPNCKVIHDYTAWENHFP